MATLLISSIAQASNWNLFWTTVGVLAGNYIDQNVFGPKTHTEGTKLDDLQVQTSTAGAAIPKVYGTVRTSGNVIWSTNYVEHKHEEHQGGKGGGGGGVTSTTYTYTVSFAIAICSGPISGIGRVWADGNIFDLSKVTHTIYYGTEDQMPDSYIEGHEGSGNVPAHRGLAYIVFQDLDVTNFGNRIPNFSFEVTKEGSVQNSSLTTTTTTDLQITNPHTPDDGGIDPNFSSTYTLTTTMTKTITRNGQSTSTVVSTKSINYSYSEAKAAGIINFLGIPIATYPYVKTTTTTASDGTDLASVVNTICIDMGLPISQIDTASLAGNIVPGFKTAGDKSGRDQIQTLQKLFVFDAIEDEGKILFKERDFSQIYVINADDLGATEDISNTDEPYKVVRGADIELPKSITLQYLSRDNDYQQGTVTRHRQCTKSISNTSVDLSFVLYDSYAMTLADTLLYQAWQKRTSYEFTLGMKWAFLRPGDIVALPLKSGKTALVLITKTSFGMPGIIKVSGQSVYSATYSLTNRTVDPGTSTELPPAPTDVTFEFLDIPQLPSDTTTTNSDSIYVATTGNVFNGSNVFQSTDNGASYNLMAYRTPKATMGTASTVLGSGTTLFWDNANTLTVVLKSGTLESHTESEVLNGANAAVVGNEIIQFKNALMLSESTWKLSGLLRGRLGTEHYTASHVASERFILLDQGTLGKITVANSQWYIPLKYRVGPMSLAVDNDLYTEATFTSNGNMALPLSPCHVAGTRDASGNITITWIRRSRGSDGWQSYVDLPLNEASEQYSVDIIKDGAVVRTLNTTAPAASYPSTMQVTDFGSNQSAVTVRVYQVSATRGRGTKAEVIV